MNSFSPQSPSAPNSFRSSDDSAAFDGGRLSNESFDNWPNWSRECRSNVPSIFRLFFVRLVSIVPRPFLFPNSLRPFFLSSNGNYKYILKFARSRAFFLGRIKCSNDYGALCLLSICNRRSFRVLAFRQRLGGGAADVLWCVSCKLWGP